MGYYPSGGPATVNTNNQTLMTYPFTYMDTFLDTYASSNGTTYITGYDSASADGYGTLILPYGNITGCLRVHCIIKEIDSSAFSIDTIAYHEYQWFKPGIHIPVAAYFVFISSFGNFYNWRYADQSVVGIENQSGNEIDISVCPNPCTKEISIAVKEQNNKQASIEIKNMSGQSVLTLQEDDLHSSFNKTIDLSFLSKGIYFLFTDMDGKRSIKKILKE